MALFAPKSRYARHAHPYVTTDARGREVTAMGPAAPPPEPTLGEHHPREGQRLDHLAAHYLDDPEGFWRIAAQNDALLPDAVLARGPLKIPRDG